MEETGNNSVNEEVQKLLFEKVPSTHQDEFLRAVIAHIRNTPTPTRQTVLDFFYDIWIGALAHDKEQRRILGAQY